MSRLWVSILTLLIYGLAQFGPALILSTGILGNLSRENLRITGIATQVVLFFIAFIIDSIGLRFSGLSILIPPQH